MKAVQEVDNFRLRTIFQGNKKETLTEGFGYCLQNFGIYNCFSSLVDATHDNMKEKCAVALSVHGTTKCIHRMHTLTQSCL